MDELQLIENEARTEGRHNLVLDPYLNLEIQQYLDARKTQYLDKKILKAMSQAHYLQWPLPVPM